jgi:hypothetical protein
LCVSGQGQREGAGEHGEADTLEQDSLLWKVGIRYTTEMGMRTGFFGRLSLPG